MLYWRIWADESGDSHLQQVPVEYQATTDYAAGVPPVDVAPAFETGSAHFSRLAAGWLGDWHPVPARQVVVLLSGLLEITVSDGSVMLGEAGCVWLAEDTTGMGHRTRVIGDEDAVRISILLPEAQRAVDSLGRA